MTHILLYNTKIQTPRVPAYIDAVALTDHFVKNPDREKTAVFTSPGSVYHFRGNENALGFPLELVLTTRMRKFEADVIFFHDGIIFSQRFHDLLTDHDRAALRIANLVIVNRKNDSIVDKPYYFGKFTRIISCVDRENSFWAKRLRDDGSVMTDGFGEEAIGRIDRLVLDTSQFDSLSLIEPKDLFPAWLVSEELGNKIIEHNILGLEIVMVDEYPDYRPRIDTTDPAWLTILTEQQPWHRSTYGKPTGTSRR